MIIITVMRRIPSFLASLGALVLAVGCGSEDSSSPRPSVVVTTSILGAVVSDVLGEAAEVTVLVPNGTDPHDWEPSAKDVEAIGQADLVVSNGLDLEEKLVETLESAEADGVRVFHATDHIEPLNADDGHDHDEAKESGGAEHDHEHAEGDPHFWTDPLAMAAVVDALGVELSALGIDVGDRVERVMTDLRDVDGVITQLLASLPDDRRVLVTGHESLGYFAEHYEFELLGSIVPGLTSAADVNAADLAELKEAIEATGVSVIFTELGTPTDVADALASETGTRVVELSTHLVPEDNLYRSFLLNLASDIVTALSATS
ncbi:MAG: zinc transporter ZnuA [Actinomycetota bacterium]